MSRSDNIMAASQFKSFNSQTIFLAEQLLKYSSFDCSISLETIGDVGFEGEENKIIELKNADSKNHNPLSNSSLDLWKTIFNWAMFFYENKEKNIEQYKLQLLVFTENNGGKEIAEKMNNCYTEEQFNEIENDIITIILKKQPRRRCNLQTIKDEYNFEKTKARYYIMCLFSKELYPYFKKIIINFKYYKYETTYLENLKSLIKREYGCNDQEILNDMVTKYLGWIQMEISRLTGENKPIIIKTEKYHEFSEKYIAPKLDGEKYRTHDTLIPSNAAIEGQVQDSPNYIQQLEIINLDKQVQSTAAYYFLKLWLERRNWIQSGYLSCLADSKYESYQKKVQRNWLNIKGLVDGINEIAEGKMLFKEMLKSRQGQFDGVNLDPELEKGFIHELANLPIDNNLSIGWHPKYKELLKNDNKENKEEK